MLFLVEANEKYTGELAQFKKEVLLYDKNRTDQFAGCMGLRDCSTEKDWIKLCNLRKRTETCEQAGTTGQSKAIQAVQIRLTGEKKDEYQILYRAHVANDGWQNYVTTDEIAGTTGESKDLQAIQIVLLKKEKDVDVENKDLLSYSTSVQDLGWTGEKWRTKWYSRFVESNPKYKD